MDISPIRTNNQRFSSIKNVETALLVGKNSTASAQKLLRSAVPDGLGHQHYADLRLVLGLGRQPSINGFASNTTVRHFLVPVFIDVIMSTWSLLGGRQMQFLTVSPGDWHIDEKAPVLRPRIWRAESSRWFDQLGFTGIGAFELAPFLNHPAAEFGRVVSPHLHAIGYADDESSYPEKVTALNARFSSRNAIGAFAVNVQVRQTEGDVAMVARYLIDQLRHAKRLTPSQKHPGKLKHRKADLPFHLALRCAEMLSYLKFTDLLVTRGNAGWHWRQQLIRSLGPPFMELPLVQEDLDDLWRGVWMADGRTNYRRVVAKLGNICR